MADFLTEKRKRELRSLESVLGVNFSRLELLNRALTHSSYANESRGKIVHNERLEFLGDAVLELAASTYLYRHFHLPEGELTKIRASIVRSETLAVQAKRLGLGNYLLLGRGEEMSGGRERQTNLEDAFESVVGAIYLDQGFDVAREYVERVLGEEFRRAASVGEIIKDHKTALQELVHKTPGHDIAYEDAGEEGPPHARTFRSRVLVDGKVLGDGIGHSKKAAEQEAAKAALTALKRK